MEVVRGVFSLLKFICWYMYVRLKSFLIIEVEKSVLLLGLGVMLREVEWYYSKYVGDIDVEKIIVV